MANMMQWISGLVPLAIPDTTIQHMRQAQVLAMRAILLHDPFFSTMMMHTALVPDTTIRVLSWNMETNIIRFNPRVVVKHNAKQLRDVLIHEWQWWRYLRQPVSKAAAR